MTFFVFHIYLSLFVISLLSTWSLVGVPFSIRTKINGEQIARSATRAILRFLRKRGNLICSLQFASSAPILGKV